MRDTIQAKAGNRQIEMTSAGGKVEPITVQTLLVATGRGPVTDGLGAEQAGLEMERGYVKVDPLIRTNVPGISAVGDVITMGMILHDWNLEKKMHLVRAAYDALPPGGAFVVIENLIDDSRRENTFGLLMSLNMLIEFGDAFDFTAADFFGWCREVGFSRTEVIPLAGPASAGVAYK
jgi:hypothetical protein